MRYLTENINKDLSKKMVLLSGPRQVGKSTLAKSLLDQRGVYLNWDILKDQKIVRQISWPKDASLVVLDEIHKYKKWRNHLKGIVDEYKNRPPILVTGSARLETFRRSGDALTGRQFHYRLHPIDVQEAGQFITGLSPEDCLSRLLETGGFPEAFLNREDAPRLQNERLDFVLREDLRDLSRTNALRDIEFLIELLRERVSGLVSYTSLSEDLSVSSPTVKKWVELLERLYLVFRVYPFSGGFSRSLKKEPKVYFFDCAEAHENQKSLSARLENLVACSLLKFCHWRHDVQGKRYELWFFRDREKREVDFVVTLNRKPFWCIEVKTREDGLSPHLKYLHHRFNPTHGSFQLVQYLERPQEVEGIRIVSCAQWLNNLSIV